jgi:hypothetical protein
VEGFSRDTPSDPCTEIVLRFSPSVYTFSESERAQLTIQANPPPSRDIILSITTPDSSLTASPAELTLTSSRGSAEVEITGYNDVIALQSPRTFTVSFDTDSAANKVSNTAQLVITDNDVVMAMFDKTDDSEDESVREREVCVSLSSPVAEDVTVRVTGEVLLETATPSAPELGEWNRELTFAPDGSLTECISFTVTDDSDVEDDEQYRLSLETVSPRNDSFSISPNGTTAVVAIVDDDSTEPDSSSLPLEAIIGAAAGGAVLALLFAFLCILCLCIWRFNVKRQGFYHTHEDSPQAPTMLRYSASLRSISSQSIVVSEGKRGAQKENEFFV